MPGRKHGRYGRVQMDAAGGTTYVTVADISKWSLKMSKDKVDVTAFGDTNKQKVLGLPDFSGDIALKWNSATSPALFAAILGVTAVGLKLIPDYNEATYNFSGLAYLDGSVDVDVNGAITGSSTFDAAGNWTIAP